MWFKVNSLSEAQLKIRSGTNYGYTKASLIHQLQTKFNKDKSTITPLSKSENSINTACNKNVILVTSATDKQKLVSLNIAVTSNSVDDIKENCNVISKQEDKTEDHTNNPNNFDNKQIDTTDGTNTCFGNGALTLLQDVDQKRQREFTVGDSAHIGHESPDIVDGAKSSANTSSVSHPKDLGITFPKTSFQCDELISKVPIHLTIPQEEITVYVVTPPNYHRNEDDTPSQSVMSIGTGKTNASSSSDSQEVEPEKRRPPRPRKKVARNPVIATAEGSNIDLAIDPNARNAKIYIEDGDSIYYFADDEREDGQSLNDNSSTDSDNLFKPGISKQTTRKGWWKRTKNWLKERLHFHRRKNSSASTSTGETVRQGHRRKSSLNIKKGNKKFKKS